MSRVRAWFAVGWGFGGGCWRGFFDGLGGWVDGLDGRWVGKRLFVGSRGEMGCATGCETEGNSVNGGPVVLGREGRGVNTRGCSERKGERRGGETGNESRNEPDRSSTRRR